MASNLPNIAAMVECLTPETEFKTVVAGIREWGNCDVVTAIIVTVLPGKEELFSNLRIICAAVGLKLIPSVKVSPCLPIAATVDGKDYNKFDYVEGWTNVADSIARACHYARTSIVLLEAESAMKGYVKGIKYCEIDPARLARCFRQLPRGIRMFWYPTLTYIDCPEHNRQLAAMRLLLTEQRQITFVDTSIGMPCDYGNPRVKKNEELLRDLTAEFYVEWAQLYRMLWCYGDDTTYWPDKEIVPAIISAIESPDLAILYPGLGLEKGRPWPEAAASIGRLLNIADGKREV